VGFEPSCFTWGVINAINAICMQLTIELRSFPSEANKTLLMAKNGTKVAVGTNLAAASIIGISGFVRHLINNNIDYLIVIVIGPAAMIGGYFGVRYTNRFSDKNLKRLIALVSSVVAFEALKG